MKFINLRSGRKCLMVFLCLFALPNVYGSDSRCSEAKDLYSCLKLVDICQPAFEHLENETREPVFSACIANPEVWTTETEDYESGLNSCNSLPTKHLWRARVAGENHNVQEVVKVKVCHISGNTTFHTILIECSELKNLGNYEDDYLGACQL